MYGQTNIKFVEPLI